MRDFAEANSRQSIALESESAECSATPAIAKEVDSKDSDIAVDSKDSKAAKDSKSGALKLIEKPLRALQKGEVLVKTSLSPSTLWITNC